MDAELNPTDSEALLRVCIQALARIAAIDRRVYEPAEAIGYARQTAQDALDQVIGVAQ